MTEVKDRATGLPYWYEKSDFGGKGECWHIYSSAYYDAWVFNLFSEEEFKKRFEEVEGQ